MCFGKEFARMNAEAHRAAAEAEGDYIGEDGFVHCGKCGDRKEVSVMIESKDGPVEHRPYVMCRCKREELERQERDRIRRDHEAKVNSLRKASCIPPDFRDATFDAFRTREDNSAILKMTRRYAENFEKMEKQQKGLLLHGNVGSGKTFAAACIGNYLLETCKSVYFTSTKNMLRLRSEEEEKEYEEMVFGSSLLIVDDIGSERTNEFGRERVLAYIDGRVNSEKPMICTTNLNFNDMLNPKTVEEARIYDRILKKCFPIAFKGESFRRGEAREGFNGMKRFLQGDDNA